MKQQPAAGILKLKKGRDKSLRRKHPWIFSGAVESIQGISANGEIVKVFSFENEFLGMASVSLQSQIRARMWAFEDVNIDRRFIYQAIENALQLRKQKGLFECTNAIRIVNSEADFMPGLIADLYDDVIVCQLLSAGVEFFKSEIISCLDELIKPKAIVERSDTDSRKKEGLNKCAGLLAGTLPDDKISIFEGETKFLVDVVQGHKTGFYLDQRDNRKIAASFCMDKEVLNCFSYTGGFGIRALANGAKTLINIDTSADALKIAEDNARLNQLDPGKMENITGDVFKALRTFRDANRLFDVIILDPPKFAESASQIEKAARGYKDINLLAMKLLKPGGLLFTFSCSGHMVPELFRKVVSDAAIDAERRVELVRTLQQASDHPVLLNFPESFYLKGLVCRVW
ncbi:MAG TPA: class I SAM-dependent methyltransferase [Bacteroidales bacterium]|nr:class I SAM-dependent methyltransferase [Bacteroidales bacterium]HRX96196.1 class I SAM-dependent methyltransferase [Bacteroidales bacterium]